MKQMRYLLIVAALLLVLAGCSSNTTSLDGNTTSKEHETVEERKAGPPSNSIKDEADLSLLDYFLPDGSAAHYKGEGNEYAEYDITVDRPADDYVIVHENNGGAFIQKVYKVEHDAIVILQEEPTQVNADVPQLEELEAMEPIGTYFVKPEVGATFDQWKVTETNATVETPYQTFDDAVVIEMEDEEFVNRRYFVKGFGEVKRESIMTHDETVKVESVLETVTKPSD